MWRPLLVVALCAAALPALARDQIRVVGSATVYPFTSAVAETFARSTHAEVPAIEITGTVAGITQFCAGLGEQYADIVNASRRMSADEIRACAANGVTDIAEITIGYDGIVLATHKGPRPLALTRVQVWRALAARIPVDGHLVDNPLDSWKQVDPALPEARIEVLGPPPTSGTRDVFLDLVMHGACLEAPEIARLSEAERKAACTGALREDGRYVEAGEYYNLIVQRLAASRGRPLGLFPFSYLAENSTQVEGIAIDGVAPTAATISSGGYALARPLFLYVKRAQIGKVRGIAEFLAEYTSEQALGPSGYLAARGLVPLAPADRSRQAALAAGLAATPR